MEVQDFLGGVGGGTFGKRRSGEFTESLTLVVQLPPPRRSTIVRERRVQNSDVRLPAAEGHWNRFLSLSIWQILLRTLCSESLSGTFSDFFFVP